MRRNGHDIGLRGQISGGKQGHQEEHVMRRVWGGTTPGTVKERGQNQAQAKNTCWSRLELLGQRSTVLPRAGRGRVVCNNVFGG